MSRLRDATAISVGIRPIAMVVVGVLLAALGGCDGLDGRRRTRAGNAFYREGQFIDAAAQYEEALKTVPSPIVHYNAGLAYSKMFSSGGGDALRIGVKGSFECNVLPNVKYEPARVCIKAGDRRFDDCDDKNVCAASYVCTQTELCTLTSPVIAAAAADHFHKWIDANPKDDETRAIMTQIWEESKQNQLALDYWNNLLKERPGDMNVMGNLAGINLRAGNWRESIDLYLQVAEKTADTSQKVSMYQNIANVAWNRLKPQALTLTQAEQIEIADMGIGALQKAAELAPKNPSVWGLQGSLLNFRALAHGASWAAFIERANAQDPQRTARVIRDEAKKAQGEGVPTPPATTPPTGGTPTPNPSPAAAGGSAQKAGG